MGSRICRRCGLKIYFDSKRRGCACYISEAIDVQQETACGTIWRRNIHALQHKGVNRAIPGTFVEQAVGDAVCDDWTSFCHQRSAGIGCCSAASKPDIVSMVVSQTGFVDVPRIQRVISARESGTVKRSSSKAVSVKIGKCVSLNRTAHQDLRSRIHRLCPKLEYFVSSPSLQRLLALVSSHLGRQRSRSRGLVSAGPMIALLRKR
jgi:hypothetical protein